jgi:hypothetical protein
MDTVGVTEVCLAIDDVAGLAFVHTLGYTRLIHTDNYNCLVREPSH